MNPSLHDARILVFEGDPNAQLITVDLLRLAGAQNCYPRKSVASAMVFSESMPQIDQFLVDINIPGQSGYDLIKAVRESETLRNEKVVAVTAGTLEDDVNKARELGFDGFYQQAIKDGLICATDRTNPRRSDCLGLAIN